MANLFEDIFDIKDIDPEGRKFDRGKQYFPATAFIWKIFPVFFARDWIPVSVSIWLVHYQAHFHFLKHGN